MITEKLERTYDFLLACIENKVAAGSGFSPTNCTWKLREAVNNQPRVAKTGWDYVCEPGYSIICDGPDEPYRVVRIKDDGVEFGGSHEKIEEAKIEVMLQHYCQLERELRALEPLLLEKMGIYGFWEILESNNLKELKE
jgi:hypothetical protein